MHSVKIEGFETKEGAVEFMNWYSGQGEQDIDNWMECRQEEGTDLGDNSFMVNSIDKDTLTMKIS